MVSFVSAGGSGPDYIQADQPSNPQNGETWFDTDANAGGGELKMYDGDAATWTVTGYTSHGDLTGVTRGAHHPPVSVSGPVTQPSDQTLDLDYGDGLTTASGTLVADLGNGLGIDSTGQVYVPTGAVGTSEIATGAVGSAEVASGAVGSSEVATGAVGTSEIGTGAVGSAEIDTGAVTGTEIDSGAVTDSEVATGTTLSVNVSGDADTVDGQHAGDISPFTLAKSGTVTVAGGGAKSVYTHTAPVVVALKCTSVGGTFRWESADNKADGSTNVRIKNSGNGEGTCGYKIYST